MPTISVGSRTGEEDDEERQNPERHSGRGERRKAAAKIGRAAMARTTSELRCPGWRVISREAGNGLVSSSVKMVSKSASCLCSPHVARVDAASGSNGAVQDAARANGTGEARPPTGPPRRQEPAAVPLPAEVLKGREPLRGFDELKELWKHRK